MKKITIIIIYLFFTSSIYSQGSIPMNKKAFIGALEFLPNGKLAVGYSRVKSAYPMHIDPVIDPKNWYVENNQQMSGMLGDAVLFIEWWTKATSPSERYKFDWTSSGYFEVNYIDDKGQNKYQRIDRYKLEKYPNLLQRFDNITPIDINFEITFHSGSISDQDYAGFRKRYNIMESLGSAGYAVNYTRKLNGDFILYKPSRKKQDWINPGIVQGGWNTFLNIPEKYKDKESRLIELFKMGTTLEISSFRISSIKWRISDFIYIAKKFEDYETGKDKPTAFDEVANAEKENKAGDGFWDETDLVDNETESFYDENKRKYGIRTLKKKILLEGKYDEIKKSPKEKFYIAKKDKTIFILNNTGKEVYSKTFSEYPNYGTCDNGSIWITEVTEKNQVGDYNYYTQTGNHYSFHQGKLILTTKWWDSYQPASPLTILVSSGNDERTYAQKKADEERYEAERERKIKDRNRILGNRTNEFRNNGFVLLKSIGCK